MSIMMHFEDKKQLDYLKKRKSVASPFSDQSSQTVDKFKNCSFFYRWQCPHETHFVHCGTHKNVRTLLRLKRLSNFKMHAILCFSLCRKILGMYASKIQKHK